jgi:hypothetical protein
MTNEALEVLEVVLSRIDKLSTPWMDVRATAAYCGGKSLSWVRERIADGSLRTNGAFQPLIHKDWADEMILSLSKMRPLQAA